jgi:hypothetical protein
MPAHIDFEKPAADWPTDEEQENQAPAVPKLPSEEDGQLSAPVVSGSLEDGSEGEIDDLRWMEI